MSQVHITSTVGSIGTPALQRCYSGFLAGFDRYNASRLHQNTAIRLAIDCYIYGGITADIGLYNREPVADTKIVSAGTPTLPRHYRGVTGVLQGHCKGKVTARLKRSGNGMRRLC